MAGKWMASIMASLMFVAIGAGIATGVIRLPHQGFVEDVFEREVSATTEAQAQRRRRGGGARRQRARVPRGGVRRQRARVPRAQKRRAQKRRAQKRRAAKPKRGKRKQVGKAKRKAKPAKKAERKLQPVKKGKQAKKDKRKLKPVKKQADKKSKKPTKESRAGRGDFKRCPNPPCRCEDYGLVGPWGNCREPSKKPNLKPVPWIGLAPTAPFFLPGKTVDPKDLKKYDPKPPTFGKIEEPPAPPCDPELMRPVKLTYCPEMESYIPIIEPIVRMPQGPLSKLAQFKARKLDACLRYNRIRKLRKQCDRRCQDPRCSADGKKFDMCEAVRRPNREYFIWGEIFYYTSLRDVFFDNKWPAEIWTGLGGGWGWVWRKRMVFGQPEKSDLLFDKAFDWAGMKVLQYFFDPETVDPGGTPPGGEGLTRMGMRRAYMDNEGYRAVN